jgi:hypothetical protein
VALTRVPVTFSAQNPTVANIDDDAGEPSSEPKATTGVSIDRGAAGIGAFAVLCGGTDVGSATVTASEQVGLNDADVVVTVLGSAASIELAAAPPQLVCDNVNTSTITATVRDVNGELVLDGTPVHFDVSSVGVVDPINTTTVNGVVTTTFRGFSTWSVGVPVVATSGSQQNSILIICNGVADVDGDSMPNAYENTRSCLDSTVADSGADQDVDGLSSFDEFAVVGTEPCQYDTDTDGCADGEEVESGRSHLTGGQRDPLNHWDFYDVNSTRTVNGIDINTVRANFTGPNPTPPDEVHLDRSFGDAAWAPGPPDGVLNGFDVNLVRLSFNDRCDLAP